MRILVFGGGILVNFRSLEASKCCQNAAGGCLEVSGGSLEALRRSNLEDAVIGLDGRLRIWEG